MWGLGDDNPDDFDFKVGYESEVRRFLRGARPTWAQKDLDKVELKLSKIGIKSLSKLVAALGAEADPSLNSQLQAHGEKGFAAETLGALRGQVDKPLPEAQVVLNRQQVAAPPKPATPSTAAAPAAAAAGTEEVKEESVTRPAPQPEAPVVTGRAQEFEVTAANVAVHNRPDAEAQWLGRRMQGQTVWAEEETFDGWVKLTKNKGWIKRAHLLQDNKNFEHHLQPVGEMLPLPTWEMSERPGERTFHVVHNPHVPIRAVPSIDSPPLSVVNYGDMVTAETQKYDGWVRLAEGKGWMQSFSKESGAMLLCPYYVHLPSWSETTRLAKISLNPTNDNIVRASVKESFYREYGRQPGDLQLLRGAILGAKAYGRVPPADIRAAEIRAEALRWGRGNVVDETQRQSEEDERKQEEERKFALENLTVTISAGDPGAIKQAVDKVRALGVPKQEIARVYSLASGSINLADR